jgi:hypothetical protein
VNIDVDGQDIGGSCSGGGDYIVTLGNSQYVKLLGVSVHNLGTPTTFTGHGGHPFYLSATQRGTEIGWCRLNNIPNSRGVIQIHQDSFGGPCWGTKQLTDITIHDTVLHDLYGQPFVFDGGTGDITMWNTLVYNAMTAGAIYDDILSLRGNGGTLNFKGYNNTFYVNPFNTGAGVLINFGGVEGITSPLGCPQSVQLYNNIFYVQETQDTYYRKQSQCQSEAYITSNNNIWFGSSAGMPTFAGPNELSRDPLFVDPTIGNLRVVSPTSPAIDSGTSLTNTIVTIDLDGNVRPQGAGTDIGAFEATGVTLPAPQNVVLRKK